MSGDSNVLAFHATVECKPDKVGVFLQWKREEACVQRNAYGFVKSMVLQPITRPEIFFYMSFWDRPDALVRLQQNDAFIDVSRKFGVPMYSPSVRDGVASQTADDAARHPLL